LANNISKLSILTIAVLRNGTDTWIHNVSKEDKMVNVGLFVRLEAKPGKEKAVAGFLETALKMANQESTTPIWFALKLGPSTFGVFDAFANEEGRQNHLTGKIGTALMANAPDLLATPPVIERLDVLGAKLAA
jgi:quinol monooxygenase YgiN